MEQARKIHPHYGLAPCNQPRPERANTEGELASALRPGMVFLCCFGHQNISSMAFEPLVFYQQPVEFSGFWPQTESYTAASLVLNPSDLIEPQCWNLRGCSLWTACCATSQLSFLCELIPLINHFLCICTYLIGSVSLENSNTSSQRRCWVESWTRRENWPTLLRYGGKTFFLREGGPWGRKIDLGFMNDRKSVWPDAMELAQVVVKGGVREPRENHIIGK